MENVINFRYPHVGEQIFKSMDTPGLVDCLEVSQTWKELAGNVLMKRWKGKIYSKMYEACKNGETKIVKILLERCTPEECGLNIRDDGGYTPFMMACKNGHKDVVKLLLDNSEGIDLNIKSRFTKMTALMWACENGHKDVVQSLLEHSDSRIDVNATTDYGRTALMIASQRGHQDIVQLFMSHSERIDMNAKDTSGWTAVKLAYSNGHEDVVQLFLDQPGSNISLNELKALLDEASELQSLFRQLRQRY